ncbi:MAG: hypothetical protein V4628_13635 [Pseudomonadota bacterium]
MNPETENQILGVLREIRDNQIEALQTMKAQQALVKEQIELSRTTVAESVDLQRLALKRQRTVTLIAVPGILFCIAAILYLVMRYF